MRAILIIVVASLVVGALPWWAFGAAEAHHYHASAYGGDPKRHVRTLHWGSSGHGTLDEDICHHSNNTSSLTHATLKSYIWDALHTGSQSRWNWLGSSNQVDLYQTTNECWSYSGDTSWIEIWAQAWIDASPYCGGASGQYSCVNYGLEFMQNGAVIDYWQGYIYFTIAHLTGTPASRQHVINHEFGHLMGLMDPPVGGPCAWPFTPTPDSIMHQYTVYGCPVDKELPRANDRSSVTQNVMPYPHIIN